jgi:hypothetical protein
MANTNQPQSFKIAGPVDETYVVTFNNVASGVSFKPGDVVYVDSNGYQTSVSGKILGLALTGVLDTNGVPATSGGSGNNYTVKVNTDPRLTMIAQVTTFAVNDLYDTANARAACFDIAGSSGVQYIDAGASSTDDIVIIGLASEFDTGIQSEVGSYAKVFCQFNPTRHFRSSVS